MRLTRTTRSLALAAGLALAAPAAALAGGGGSPPADPPIVGVPMERTAKALSNAADAIDAGKGASAVGPLTASRRYLIRSYKGAKYLIENCPPPPPASDGSANPRKFVRLARRSIRSRSAAGGNRVWIRARTSVQAHTSGSEGGATACTASVRAHTSGSGGGGPTFADPPTAVFDVFTSQFNAATAAVGLVADVKGNLLNRVQRALNTAVVLRNRLVKIIHQNEPPAPPAEDGSVHAHASGGAVVGSPYAAIMPGLTLLIDVELQQMRATSKDTSVPSASRDALSKAIAADKFIENRINQWWPPAPAGD